MLDRYDELKEKTELTKDEQEELDSIILKVAEDVPGAITEFDKYGKALDISTSAARKFIQQQKDLLALDNAEAIAEQEDAIVDLSNSLKILNKEYIVQDGVLKKVKKNYKSGTERLIDATDKEIRAFQKTAAAIGDEIVLREAKIAKLKGEKTELEVLAEAEAASTETVEENTTATKENTKAKKEKREVEKTTYDLISKNAKLI